MNRLLFGRMALGVFVLILILRPIMVDAHTPSGVTLEYNASTSELTVSVSHIVSDVNTHYIEQIVIEKNSVEVATRNYDLQDTTSGMSDTFMISAEQGDILRATAFCSISGQLSAQITVSSETTTSESDTNDGSGQPTNSTLLILVAVAVIGVVALLALKRR